MTVAYTTAGALRAWKSLCLESLACNAGLSLSLLQQRLRPTLLPPRISLWISHRQHPTSVPYFTNIRKPPPQPGWFRSSATVAIVFRRHPERTEGPLYLLFVFAVALVLLAFLAVIPEGESTHVQPSRGPPKNHPHKRPERSLTPLAPDTYPASPEPPSSALGRSSVTSCGVSRSTCFLSASGVPSILNSGFCAFSTENV
jgi:hypothetical protein